MLFIQLHSLRLGILACCWTFTNIEIIQTPDAEAHPRIVRVHSDRRSSKRTPAIWWSSRLSHPKRPPVTYEGALICDQGSSAYGRFWTALGLKGGGVCSLTSPQGPGVLRSITSDGHPTFGLPRLARPPHPSTCTLKSFHLPSYTIRLELRAFHSVTLQYSASSHISI